MPEIRFSIQILLRLGPVLVLLSSKARIEIGLAKGIAPSCLVFDIDLVVRLSTRPQIGSDAINYLTPFPLKGGPTGYRPQFVSNLPQL